MDLNQYEIYAVFCSDAWYVGKTFGARMSSARRFEQHMTGKGGANKLWSAVQQRGRDAFSFVVLEEGSGDHVGAERWWYWFGVAFETRECLNGGVPSRGGSLPGQILHTEASRNAMSIAQRGIPNTRAHNRAISAALRGKPKSAAHVRALRAAVRTPASARCCDCGMISTPGAMGNHFRASNHKKEVPVKDPSGRSGQDDGMGTVDGRHS